MTTSGTATFNLSILEIIEEAYERIGQELRSGYDLKTARRSLNLLTIELANRGINLWTIESDAIPLYVGSAAYDLPADTIDLLDQVIRTGSDSNQIDISMSRISTSSYATIPNKNATGKPIQVLVERRSGATYPTVVVGGFLTDSTGDILVDSAGDPLTSSDASSVVNVTNNPRVIVWPMPDRGTVAQPYYYLVYWRLRRIQDVGNGDNTQDIPFRFLNVLIAGLSYYLAMKSVSVDPNRVAALKADYEQQFQLASEEDREKANFRFVPRVAR